jgi:predicted ABC-type ATPase
LTLPDAETAIARVASRVRLGGHNVPDEDIKRRFDAGIRNFFQSYLPVVTTGKVFDNFQPSLPVLIAEGGRNLPLTIHDDVLYTKLKKGYDNVSQKQHQPRCARPR